MRIERCYQRHFIIMSLVAIYRKWLSVGFGWITRSKNAKITDTPRVETRETVEIHRVSRHARQPRYMCRDTRDSWDTRVETRFVGIIPDFLSKECYPTGNLLICHWHGVNNIVTQDILSLRLKGFSGYNLANYLLLRLKRDRWWACAYWIRPARVSWWRQAGPLSLRHVTLCR